MLFIYVCQGRMTSSEFVNFGSRDWTKFGPLIDLESTLDYFYNLQYETVKKTELSPGKIKFRLLGPHLGQSSSYYASILIDSMYLFVRISRIEHLPASSKRAII